MKRFLTLASLVVFSLSIAPHQGAESPVFATNDVIVLSTAEGPCPEICRLPDESCMENCP